PGLHVYVSKDVPKDQIRIVDLPLRKVTCPTCGKLICKATPGSTVAVICNRCKTESVTAVAA
ncbi:MAG: hypothetical protein M3Q75_01575, partial [Gemmatimonadota bacterium]|nr:hypothetical protein [Gemmatimonadota bacterium]